MWKTLLLHVLVNSVSLIKDTRKYTRDVEIKIYRD